MRDHRARLHILPDVDAGYADRAGERRLDRLLVEDGANFCERRLGSRERARRILESRVGIHAGLAQLLRPLHRRSVAVDRSLRRHQVGPLHRIVDLHEEIALLDLLVGGEVDRLAPRPPPATRRRRPGSRQACRSARISGFQVIGSTFVADTATAGICMVAKNSPIILVRKKLNQTSAAQRSTTSTTITRRKPILRMKFPTERSMA